MSDGGTHQGIFMILDGLGDRPCSALGGLTPLEAARTPNFDRLAARGMTGQVDPLSPGVPVGTHTGTGVVMGLSPRGAANLSRGPVEAAGVGLAMRPGEVAIRCNFATLEDRDGLLRVVDRRAGRIKEGTEELAAVVSGMAPVDGVHIEMRPAVQHRGVLLLSGLELSPAISDTDPGDESSDMLVQRSRSISTRARGSDRTAQVLNSVIREAFALLDGHPINRDRVAAGQPPANGIITRGAGSFSSLDNVVTQLGIRTAVISGGSAVSGLGHLFGFTVITEAGFTADRDTDIDAKVARTIAALDDHDLVFLSVKAPDICAHDLDPVGKRDFLEKLDAAIEPLLDLNVVIAVSADHSTDCNSGTHTGDPVPSLLCAPGGRADRIETYGETDCMAGGLGRISGTAFLTSVLDAMGRVGLYEVGDDRWLLP